MFVPFSVVSVDNGYINSSVAVVLTARLSMPFGIASLFSFSLMMMIFG